MKGIFRHYVLLGFLALAAALVVLVSASHWEDIAREYHLAKLRKDPSLLETLLLSGGPREAAVRKFLREGEGKEAFFRLYLAEFQRNKGGGPVSSLYLKGLKDDEVIVGYISLWQQGYSVQDFGNGAKGMAISDVPEDPRRRELVLDLLEACSGSPIQLEEYGHLEFYVQPVKDGKVELPPWPKAINSRIEEPEFRRGTRHICFFRVIREDGES